MARREKARNSVQITVIFEDGRTYKREFQPNGSCLEKMQNTASKGYSPIDKLLQMIVAGVVIVDS